MTINLPEPGALVSPCICCLCSLTEKNPPLFLMTNKMNWIFLCVTVNSFNLSCFVVGQKCSSPIRDRRCVYWTNTGLSMIVYVKICVCGRERDHKLEAKQYPCVCVCVWLCVLSAGLDSLTGLNLEGAGLLTRVGSSD